MTIFITDEAEIWRIWDNMKYFDKETFQEIQFPGYIQMLSSTCSYSEEATVCWVLMYIRDALSAHDGDIDAIREKISSYSVLDMFQDILQKNTTPMFMAGDEWLFEFWLKIYQRRNTSRALVHWSHYRWIFFMGSMKPYEYQFAYEHLRNLHHQRYFLSYDPASKTLSSFVAVHAENNEIVTEWIDTTSMDKRIDEMNLFLDYMLRRAYSEVMILEPKQQP